MWTDQIIKALHQSREAHARRFNFNWESSFGSSSFRFRQAGAWRTGLPTKTLATSLRRMRSTVG
jgi:hypothetical protein